MVHTGLRSGRRQALKDQPKNRPRGRSRGRSARGAIQTVAGLSIWRDRWSLRLAAFSVLAVAALIAYVATSMPTIPPFLPLHYDGNGSVDLIGPRNDLYKIPAIGAVVFGADFLLAASLHHRERVAARMLLATAILVQIMFFVATANIIRLAFGD